MESISKCPKKVEYKLEKVKHACCQTCKHHENKPSRCIKMGTYIQRKHSCMNEYVWNGQFLQRLVEVK